MKKFTLIFLASILLCFSCEKGMAQAPYKASVGGILPYALGSSFKTFLKDNFAFQVDIFFTATVTGKIEDYRCYLALYPTIETNTNIMYEQLIKGKKKTDLFWFIGGGIRLGYAFGNGKFGTNAMIGLEYVFKDIPLAFQMDLRLGYSMLFNSGDELNDYFFHPTINPWSHFDWLIGFSFRYTFKKKL